MRGEGWGVSTSGQLLWLTDVLLMLFPISRHTDLLTKGLIQRFLTLESVPLTIKPPKLEVRRSGPTVEISENLVSKLLTNTLSSLFFVIF